MSYLYTPYYSTSRRIVADLELSSALRRSRIETEIALDRVYTADALRRSRVAAEVAVEEARAARIAS